jgi:hypothetical protein
MPMHATKAIPNPKDQASRFCAAPTHSGRWRRTIRCSQRHRGSEAMVEPDTDSHVDQKQDGEPANRSEVAGEECGGDGHEPRRKRMPADARTARSLKTGMSMPSTFSPKS